MPPDDNPFHALAERIAYRLAMAYPMDLPKHLYTGEEITTPEQMAGVLGIPVTEAKVRMELKDIHSGTGAHASSVGVGTVRQAGSVYDRACATPKKRRRKRKREKDT